jgi:hypothetical protein
MTLQIGQRHFLQYLSFTNKPQPSHTAGITQYTRAAPSRLHVRFPHLELQSITFLHILPPKVRHGIKISLNIQATNLESP